jgi:IMP dehydrogenase
MKFLLKEGLTYDDVLLVPQKSTIRSRQDVNLRTSLTKKISLAIPFISSNVDTVTESEMAIAMAKLGGLGIIHRFMSIERQVNEITMVKRSEGFILGAPFTLTPTHTYSDARRLMKEHNITSLIIVDEKNKVLGLLSKRDMWFETNTSRRISEIMTPREKLITALPACTLDQARELFKKYKIEKLPLIAKDGTLTGLITSRTVLNEDRYPNATKDKHGRLRVGGAVGVVDDYLERADEMVKAGVDVLVIDIAHINSSHGLQAVKSLRKKFSNTDIIGGNIATADAARALIRLGCNALKVGIGPGGICITRMVAGSGLPQVTSLIQCCAIARKYGIPVIADGGTNYPGDMTKALATGASAVMLTGWLAGTDESPGSIILRDNKKYKAHRGAASFSAVASRKMQNINGSVSKDLTENEIDKELESVVAEGIEAFIPYKGAVKDVINQLAGALRSGMSYNNAKTIRQLWENATFIKISPASLRESRSHNVEHI